MNYENTTNCNINYIINCIFYPGNNFKKTKKMNISEQIKHYSQLHRTNYETPVDLQYIVSVVCSETGIGQDIVFKKTRKREIILSRQLIQHFAKEKTKLSLSEIGFLTGGKDHTTVLHSHKTINNISYLPEVKDLYNRIDARL